MSGATHPTSQQEVRPMISSFFTSDEYHGIVPAAEVQARFQSEFAELAARVNAKLLADVTAAKRRALETKRDDWGATGDAQGALAKLVEIALGLGIVDGIDPRHVEAF